VRERSLSSSKEIDETGERREGLGGTVRRGTTYSFTEVAGTQTRWPRSRCRWERSHSLEDNGL
jgi:hypothetical protein